MPEAKPTAIQLNFNDRERDLIERAATASGKRVAEFVIDASAIAAHDTILDQVLVRVDDETFTGTSEILDSPRDAEGAARLASVPKPWAE